jgi:Lon-like ATP-dependent protease
MSVPLQIISFVLGIAAVIGLGICVFIIITMKNKIEKSNRPSSDMFARTENSKTIKNLRDLQEQRKISLPLPLTERLRPNKLSDIIGQEVGIELLRAAICSKRPMNVIIYGPPGVGKTTAARLLYEEAKKTYGVFQGRFIQIDGTNQHYDERGIADPILGSVHDPIFQGANGSYGQNAIPEPKLGAVSNANGGILFIDEIGELHPRQMDRLLKVLEDRKVYFQSAYYDPDAIKMPAYIKDIFDNGSPADFRLIGATTKNPSGISPALRSRCRKVFFRSLTKDELRTVARNAMEKINIHNEGLLEEIVSCSENPRDVINLIELAVNYQDTHDGKIPLGKITSFEKGGEKTFEFGA